MDTTLLTGIIGALILVAGAGWPTQTASHPTNSVKNWLFTVGGVVLLAYSILNYQAGGSIFFVLLELLINVASVLMMTNANERMSTAIISVVGLGMIAWSFTLFEGYNTILFVLGICGISMGYVFKAGTVKRNLALMIGGALVAIFSYLEANWIFFWINVFFAVFSAFWMWRLKKV